VLHLMRERNADRRGAITADGEETVPPSARRNRVARLQTALDRPAIVTAVAVAGPNDAAADADGGAPLLLSVKFIDAPMLAEIADRLQLRELHLLDDEDASRGQANLRLTDPQGGTIGRFAWVAAKPGSDFLNRVVPLVALALLSFALLAYAVHRQMRRTAATIAAGETRLHHLAMHDPLCGLPNRIYFGERLNATIANVGAGHESAAVLYIDLDHFKDVNDTLGHSVGDELIRLVAQRLGATLRAEDLVARIGGDEFAVITPAGGDHYALRELAGRLIASLSAPYSINGQTVTIGASVGIASITEQVCGAADVLRHADMALYRAKAEGRNRACFYDDVMASDVVKRKSLENELRAAIENNELQLAYQPIVNASGDKLVGVEALCRWVRLERDDVHPSEFIPIAENSGLIVDLGEWALRRACLDAKAWPGITVAVNVSPLQIRRPDFVDVVERIVSETGIDQTRLELELTESTLLGNVDTAELAMFRLKALGVRLALDDFGTGYSSLLYLRRFPFDKLKIDRSFVQSIERAADTAAIVHAIVSLGRGLGMKVTAEGVETAEQHLFLRAAGVHTMQGYRFGRAASAATITARLSAPGAVRIDSDGLLMAG
jgi:diguanylate cyclase